MESAGGTMSFCHCCCFFHVSKVISSSGAPGMEYAGTSSGLGWLPRCEVSSSMLLWEGSGCLVVKFMRCSSVGLRGLISASRRLCNTHCQPMQQLPTLFRYMYCKVLFQYTCTLCMTASRASANFQIDRCPCTVFPGVNATNILCREAPMQAKYVYT